MLMRSKFANFAMAATAATNRMPSFDGKSLSKNLVAMLGSAAVTMMIVSGIAIKPADARSQCIFVATDGKGWAVATQGTARRSSTACRRAKRRCNRKLNRAKRRGQFNRSFTPSCRKHSGRGVSF